MAVKEISFPSANGRDMVKAWAYSPLGRPKGIIQLIHGYGEHSRRYLHMILKFNEAGYVVYADDHIGHGKTGYDSGTLGDPHSGGFMTYLKDEKALHDIAVADYPDIPYLVFGHSWGSMLGRAYAALYGDDLKALVLCGVCSQWKGCEDAYYNEEFKAAYEADPYQPENGWFAKVFSGMTDRVENPNSPSDWIANNPDIVTDHAGDMFNTFATTIELVYDFVQLYHYIENEEWAAKVPKDIPVYLFAGDEDPCGNYGEGLYHCANLLANTGHKISVKAYSGYRHEIHNELELRDEVEARVIAFYDGVLGC